MKITRYWSFCIIALMALTSCSSFRGPLYPGYEGSEFKYRDDDIKYLYRIKTYDNFNFKINHNQIKPEGFRRTGKRVKVFVLPYTDFFKTERSLYDYKKINLYDSDRHYYGINASTIGYDDGRVPKWYWEEFTSLIMESKFGHRNNVDVFIMGVHEFIPEIQNLSENEGVFIVFLDYLTIQKWILDSTRCVKEGSNEDCGFFEYLTYTNAEKQKNYLNIGETYIKVRIFSFENASDVKALFDSRIKRLDSNNESPSDRERLIKYSFEFDFNYRLSNEPAFWNLLHSSSEADKLSNYNDKLTDTITINNHEPDEEYILMATGNWLSQIRKLTAVFRNIFSAAASR